MLKETTGERRKQRRGRREEDRAKAKALAPSQRAAPGTEAGVPDKNLMEPHALRILASRQQEGKGGEGEGEGGR